MDPDSRAKIEQGQRMARRIVPEHKLDSRFAQQVKTVISRAEQEEGLERTSVAVARAQ